jgi:LysM repeat protein
MRKILILLVLLNSFGLFAQPGVSPKKEINGEMFYVHKVEAGNTLWGLQQMYGVKADLIMQSNPELNEGLKVGQEVLIPIPNYVKPLPKSIEYKVKRGETLYGLSRKFNTTVDELIQLNPVLSEEGLKKGQIIQVPGEEIAEVVDPVDETIPNPFVTDTISSENGQETTIVEFNDSIVNHTVLAHETMYSISRRFMVSIDKIMKTNNLTSTSLKEGQVLVIPIKQERIKKLIVKPVPELYDPNSSEPLEFEEKERYNVAMILPFHLDYGPGYSSYVSKLATQFYMGASVALDSLKSMGLNADVSFYDSKNDSTAVKELLNSGKMNGVDLIIGPFFPGTQKVVADYCRLNKIRMVCPVASSADLLEENRLVYATVPSNITIVKGLAKQVLVNNSADNIILIKSTKKSDLPLYEAFRDSFKNSPVTGKRPNLVESTLDGMKNYIRRDAKNVFVVPTVDKYMAAKFMSTLSKSEFRSRKDNIYVYGMKEWVDFTDVNNLYKNKYHFHFASPNFVDYYTDEMIEINKGFREVYKVDFAKMSVQAYDVTMFYCSSFFLNNSNPNLLMNDFNMVQLSELDGFENSNVFVIEQEEYELINTTTSPDE